jgi:hypothetical protein
MKPLQFFSVINSSSLDKSRRKTHGKVRKTALRKSSNLYCPQFISGSGENGRRREIATQLDDEIIKSSEVHIRNNQNSDKYRFESCLPDKTKTRDGEMVNATCAHV